MKVKLKDVKPNPFRNMERYPIHKQKILQLKNSIQSTDFWENIVARECDDGTIQIAYGHHRLVALNDSYPGTKEFNWIVKDLDDDEMLKIMAHENLDEWGHDSAIERETVRAVVEAYGNGLISLPKPAKNTGQNALRYAPSFCQEKHMVARTSAGPAGVRVNPYTADTINNFLGGTMSARTIQYTLQALCLVERGHLKESQLAGLSSNECRTVIEETERSLKQAKMLSDEAERKAMTAETPTLANKLRREGKDKAKRIVTNTAKGVASAIQSGQGTQAARQAATAARVAVQPKDKELPDISNAASSVAGRLHRALHPDHDIGAKLEELVKYRLHLSPSALNDLTVALQAVEEYAAGYRARLSK